MKCWHNANIILTCPANAWPKEFNGSLKQSPANLPASIGFHTHTYTHAHTLIRVLTRNSLKCNSEMRLIKPHKGRLSEHVLNNENMCCCTGKYTIEWMFFGENWDTCNIGIIHDAVE